MRRTLLLTAIAVTLAVSAQKKADIEVSYDYHYPTSNRIDNMRLLGNSEGSAYFNNSSLWLDSLLSTPGGKAKYNEIVNTFTTVENGDRKSVV